jgi:hypothetical protein
MDELFFEPGWKTCSGARFKAKLKTAMNANPQGWIMDGNYMSQGGDMVSKKATDIICKESFY